MVKLSNNSNEFIYAFLHIQKCGGTTVVKHIEKNYLPEERLHLLPEKTGIDIKTADNNIFLAKTEKYFSKISKNRMNKVRIIYGHYVPYGLEKILKKEVRYVSLLRNPIDRIFSHYDYYRTLYSRDNPSTRNKKVLYRRGLLINNKVPDFESWLKVKLNNDEVQFALTTIPQMLKKLGYLTGDVNDKKSQIKTINKFYFLGIVDDLKNNDILYLYSLFGIKKYFFNQNISDRFVNRQSYRLRRLVATRTINGINLYNQAKKVRNDFLNDNPDYDERVNIVKIRQLVKPFTQLIYDFRETLGIVSKISRKRIPYYSEIYDFIKSKL